MAEKPKKAKNTKKRTKGFYAAVYTGIGGLFVLAVAIGYYTLHTPDSPAFEISEAALPVGATQDVPVVNIPQPTIPAPTTPAAQQLQQEPAQGEQNQPPEPTTQQEVYQPDAPVEAEVVYEPDFTQIMGPAFTYFSEGDDMHWPVLGNIVMQYSTDALVFDPTLQQWRVSDAIAIQAARGDAVRAAAAGTITSIEHNTQFGTVVVIDHGNGWSTTYRQLEPISVGAVGDVVSRGQIIANVGTPSIFAGELGYHVGFGVRNNEASVNPHTVLATN